MLRKSVVALVCAFALVCGSVFAGESATEADMMAEAMALLSNQPAMTQADIDAYLQMAPQIVSLANNPMAVMQLYQDNNIDPQRFAVVSTKIAIGVSIGQGVTREQINESEQIPEFMMPNDDEMKLINTNMAALLKAMGA